VALIEAADRQDPVEFDPFSDVYFDDPYDMYRRLREEAPIYHSEQYGFYALSRYEDVVAAHKDWRTFSSTHGVDLHTLSADPATIRNFASIIMMDPPDHDRLRALVSRVFTPRAVQALEPMVREVITGFVDAIGDATQFDGVGDLSAPFPVEIISRILGVPAADRQQIRLWLDESLHREPGDMSPTQEGIDANVASGAYFYALVQEKRANPTDDMLSRLTQVSVERDDGTMTGLDDAEIAGFASLLGGAGAETVTKLVGNAFVLFARHPEQWRAVVDDPAAIPWAVEEILRYLPPSQYQGRFSVLDSEWRGDRLPAGYPVLLLTGAANRDPDAYPDPDRFDITRKPGQALGFGLGIHSCLGAALARIESRIALEAMARRWPRFSVDEDNLRRVHMSNVAGYASVPVQVG
jgi:cytochrome P450